MDGQAESLSPAVLHILMALAEGERHGYAIMQTVEAQSLGRCKMGPGTLYGSLKRMLEAGLVAESTDENESRRRFYRITDAGMTSLKYDLERLSKAVEIGRSLRLVEGSL